MSPRPQLGVGQYGNIKTNRAGKLWMATARFRDDDGETRRVSAQGTSKSGAEAALKDKFKARASEGELSSESRVKELAEKYWLDKQGDGLAPNTLYNMRRALDNHVIPRLGKLRIREATPQRLDKVVRDIATSGDHGPGTARVVRSALSGMFASAVRWGAAQSNPVAFTQVPRMESRVIRALTGAEYLAVRQYAVAKLAPPARSVGPVARSTPLDVMEFLLATGCRAGEVLGTEWADVHLDDPVPWVEIRQQVVKVVGQGLLLTPTKERDIRRLRLPRFAVDMLRRRRETVTGPMVFPSTRGTLMSPTSIATSWRNVFKGSDWEWVTQKTLRKTVATLVDAELGSVMASRQLGHASDAVTRAHYIAQSLTPLDTGLAIERFGT